MEEFRMNEESEDITEGAEGQDDEGYLPVFDGSSPLSL